MLIRYETDIHFLVARLVKFAGPKQRISLQERLVKIGFTDCLSGKHHRVSNYRLYRYYHVL